MKIFVVCNKLCFGGAERVGVMLANGLAKNGHEVTIVSNLYREVTYDIDERISVRNFFGTNRNKLLKWMSSFGTVRSYLKQERPDLVVGVMYACSFVSRIASIGLNIPVIATEHDSFERPESAPMSRWEQFTKFKLNKLYPCVTVLTDADKRFVGSRLKNVQVMPNPLALFPVTTIPTKQKIILAAGRLESWHYKGLDILLEAWGKIAERFPGWELQIAGYGTEDEIKNVQRMMTAHRVEHRVRLLGFRKDIEDLFRRSEVFVLSSRYEGFGLVLVEAMSQGCACVACDYKGRQREIITSDEEGILCKPEDVDALAESLERVLSDDMNRKKMQQNAVERSKEYLPERIMNRWERLIDKVVKEWRS